MTTQLNRKNIYIIVTGCNGTKRIKDLIIPLEKDGANCFLIPTPAAMQIMQQNADYYSDCRICSNTNISCQQKIPEEDLVIVAPCSFNTANKIVHGIADNYATSLLQTSIGKGKPVILAFSMNIHFWSHFAFQETLKKIKTIKNITTIWPEFVYQEKMLTKLTMVPFGKIIDSTYHILKVLKYKQIHTNQISNLDSIIDKHFSDFVECGRKLAKNNLVWGTSGCIAKKIDSGILVSTTGSFVGEIKIDNLSLVKECEKDTVVWEGKNYPSSETLLINYILSRTKKTHLIHSHSTEITYAQNLEYLRTQGYVETGNLDSVEQVIDILNANDGVCILKLHGQIVIADSFAEGIDKLLNLKNSIE